MTGQITLPTTDSDAMVKIAPSILSADFARLAHAVETVEPAADYVHVDVMDGHFVPNLTIGPPVVASLRKSTSLPFDCHLMISNPNAYFDDFRAAGADSCTFHIEAAPDPVPLLAHLDYLELGKGIALNPDTPFAEVEPYLDRIDILLLMTVRPGFGGQSFRDDVLPKIEAARRYIDDADLNVEIEVDGGVAPDTVRSVVDAGATVLVAGSAIFDSDDHAAMADELRGIATGNGAHS